MKHQLVELIQKSVKDLFGVEVTVELSRPDEQFGDYSTNVALQLSKKLSKNPREIAEMIAASLKSDTIASAEIAGPGFINITLSDRALLGSLEAEVAQVWSGKTIVTEYSDPNPFKVLHVGHLYTSIVGDAISSLLEQAGATVHRVNFGGDVGMHVAKTMWAILNDLGGELPEKLAAIPEDNRSDWMAKNYVAGTQAYETDETAKTAIVALNKRVYQLHNNDDRDSPFAQIYWTCRQWSYDYFDSFYARIGSHFEKYYPESQTAPIGLATVKEQLQNGVFELSEGAVVFNGEKHGLHTRVFINSEGLPTYEAKDVGLSIKKWEDYHFDESVIITGNDITEYMKVILAAIGEFQPELAERTVHMTHGNVKLAGGVKMSSRKGNFLRAVDVLDMVRDASKEVSQHDDEKVVLGAVKYALLKHRIGSDIIFEPTESVAIEGNSGPYLQYAHARARSILAKGQISDTVVTQLEADERRLVRKIGEWAETVDKAVAELMPHHICTYLYELAQTFNRFYEHNRVMDDPREAIRLQLVQRYADVLKAGLGLVGIHAPDKM
ncbi:arginine--tRNA ligase [soil metagenome]